LFNLAAMCFFVSGKIFISKSDKSYFLTPKFYEDTRRLNCTVWSSIHIIKKNGPISGFASKHTRIIRVQQNTQAGSSITRVKDPHLSNEDPDPAFHLNANPDPTFLFKADTDPVLHLIDSASRESMPDPNKQSMTHMTAEGECQHLANKILAFAAPLSGSQ
jgi:hypothetical protein